MNPTITTQLNHRTIRSFKDTPISQDIITTLVDVAQQTATSSFRQAYSIISITDKKLQEAIGAISGQPYVGTAPHLFIVALDLYRNHQIAKENGVDTAVVMSADRFLAAAMDTGLVVQNMVVAAESLDLGTVILGSIQNDAQQMIELLQLPKHTFPLLGLAIGYPNEQPQLKPRLPQSFIHFENSYKQFDNLNTALHDYNNVVTTYYDLRDKNNRVDTFTNQVTNSMLQKHPKRMKNLEVLHNQDLIKI
ncbi:NADPH-dependent oxidoreductase [Erysipelothrix sp. HDW6C]|uniref:NADPH-dependent oxidoreductase n=1 Tax=Erysipelothrix sp. HDW6C TaxID=2714930 RepID=UPI00140A1AB0|nr:NADPH-dependent oxidoreductase [Erysipelothrix sp. HDW6C]QIK70784.1 NADPH-dependent oxidoreductase [Erysipelothrix sp. HDW6C]